MVYGFDDWRPPRSGDRAVGLPVVTMRRTLTQRFIESLAPRWPPMTKDSTCGIAQAQPGRSSSPIPGHNALTQSHLGFGGSGAHSATWAPSASKSGSRSTGLHEADARRRRPETPAVVTIHSRNQDAPRPVTWSERPVARRVYGAIPSGICTTQEALSPTHWRTTVGVGAGLF